MTTTVSRWRAPLPLAMQRDTHGESMCEEPEEPSGTPSQPTHRSWGLWAVTLEKLKSASGRRPGYGSFLKRSWGNCSLALDSKLEDPAKIHSHSEHSKPVRQDMSTCPRVWVKLVTQQLLNNMPVRIDNCWSKDSWWRESFILFCLIWEKDPKAPPLAEELLTVDRH